MPVASEGRTIDEVFAEAVERYGASQLLCVPPQTPPEQGGEPVFHTFRQVADQVKTYAGRLAAAGYGHGHRVAALTGNTPDTLTLKLACARLGISFVPVNPDYRAAEIAYLLQDSAAGMLIATERFRDAAAAGIGESGREVALASIDDAGWPRNASPAPASGPVTPQTEASLLYTSGSTGRPKGCILSHEYELELGRWYHTRGGILDVREGLERVYCPLPLFHVNAGILLFHAMIQTGNCHIIPERFSASRWWSDIRATHASIVHYLGIIIPALMNEPFSMADRQHLVRWGVGAGVEPSLHRAFEERFGFPLVEVWGMTEMCRVFADNHEPRMPDTRAFGRPVPGLEVRIVDGADKEVPWGTPGEMVVRHSAGTPRKGAFCGYLNQPEATEEAWRGGWFHTGDTVMQDESGMLFFVDRKKNIIRRSGENIAAAEVENCLLTDNAVAQVAVISAPDGMRDEEVMACVVAAPGVRQNRETAEAIAGHCREQLAYYKAPGWIVFVESLPVTGTQKIQKHLIFGEGQDPREHPNAHDLRALKKRG